MTRLPRRIFLRAGALAGISALSYRRIAGANADVRVAVVGLNGKGRDHVEGFRTLPGVRVAALCDVDRAALDASVQTARAAGLTVEAFVDYRELLARRDIDAVSLATPNHQHALQALWALDAGKDVFVEKPVSHDLWEGRQLVRGAEKSGRIVQAGTQNRSSPAIAQAIAWQREGHLGKIVAARAVCYKRRESIGKTEGPQPLPDSLNYDLWLGPLPIGPLRRTRLHYDWHWQWATGNGDVGNQGNHQIDVARRFLGEPQLPPRVSSAGGRFGYVDDGETPNTLVVAYHYAAAPLIFEQRGLPVSAARPDAATQATAAQTAASKTAAMDEYAGLSVGTIIECEGGRIVVPSRDYSLAQAFDKRGQLVQEWKGTASHYENFIRAVKSRRASDLSAPIVEGHISSGLSHLANLSQRLGREVTPAAAARALESEPRLAEPFARLRDHLTRNRVDFALTPLRLGAVLSLEPASERFTGEHAAAATRLARAEYRKPFVVPDLGQNPVPGSGAEKTRSP
jgi:predicted dehydrogenase